jgi:hypothetical protein
MLSKESGNIYAIWHIFVVITVPDEIASHFYHNPHISKSGTFFEPEMECVLLSANIDKNCQMSYYRCN